MRLSIEHHWGKRELERQLRASLFERAILNPPKVAPAVRQMYPQRKQSSKMTVIYLDVRGGVETCGVILDSVELNNWNDLIIGGLLRVDIFTSHSCIII